MTRARSLVFAAFVALAVVAAPGIARAQAAPDDLTTLERSLAEQHDALSTTDCATACRALASIRRAADKICALDPGDRCAAGRAKADDAARRVHDACPECAIAAVPADKKPRPEDRAMSKGATKPAEPPPPPRSSSDEGATVQASAPPAESKRGGCAGCTTATRSTEAPRDLASGALAALALGFAFARRRRRR